MNLSRQIIVIGDSHSRSFGGGDYFIPIFMGPYGRPNNQEILKKYTKWKIQETKK